MPIQLHEAYSTRKSIDVTVTPSASGVTISGSVRWFNDEYVIPSVVITCVYTDDARYRVALCSSPPRLTLVEDDAAPSDEVCYLARWAFTSSNDTCESVVIEVPRRVLVPEPSTFVTDPDTGETTETPPAPLPEPTVHQVSGTPVLPTDSAEKTAGRKRLRRIRELRQQAKAMKDAGTTYASMTAAQRQVIQELTALLADVPLAVP